MHDPFSSKLEITFYILEQPRSKLGRHYIGVYEIIDLKKLKQRDTLNKTQYICHKSTKIN